MVFTVTPQSLEFKEINLGDNITDARVGKGVKRVHIVKNSSTDAVLGKVSKYQHQLEHAAIGTSSSSFVHIISFHT
jgi:hypothetical protein